MIFENEIEYISNSKAKEMAVEIVKAIEKEMNGPSSKSGRYHPKDEYCNAGLIMHCRRVCYWAVESCREHKFDSETKDAMVISSMIHDYARQVGYYNNHGSLSWKMITKKIDISNYEDIKNIIDKIDRYCSTHMNHWDRYAPMPESVEEYAFAMADYAASKENVVTPFLEKCK